MNLIYQDKARPIHDLIPYHFNEWLEFSGTPAGEPYRKIHTVRWAIAIPEIITLTEYDRLPFNQVKYSRQSLFESFNFTCAYCGKKFDREHLTRDHVIPESHGGKTDYMNLVAACKKCNFHKANRTPEQAGMKLLQKPRKPKWISPLNKVGWKSARPSWRQFMHKTLID